MNGQKWMEALSTEGKPVEQVDGDWADGIDDLEQKAQVAKKEALAKKKQIPPFVQKLSR